MGTGFKITLIKRWRQRWMKFVERHIVQFDPHTQPPAGPDADMDVLRSTVSRYFRYNQPDAAYIIEYDILYHTTINMLREEGWIVTLHADSAGELFYTVTIKNALAEPSSGQTKKD